MNTRNKALSHECKGLQIESAKEKQEVQLMKEERTELQIYRIEDEESYKTKLAL